MTQTSSPSTERLSSRQRRIAEQRRKIEAVHSGQRRKRMMWGAGVGVLVVVVVALGVLFFPRPVQGSMQQVTTETATHVDEGTQLEYAHRPPSSGMHFGTAPQPQEYRMWDTPLTPGRWVHMLEHGAVAVLYRPDKCDAACVQQLGQFYDTAPKSNLVGVRHLVVTPYQDMDHAIAVVAWGYVDEMDQVDRDRIMADYKSKVDAPSAPERGAM
jgi:hypothetical protein